MFPVKKISIKKNNFGQMVAPWSTRERIANEKIGIRAPRREITQAADKLSAGPNRQ